MVRVSDIGLYLRCPRMVYFDSLGKLERAEDPGRILLKNLMLSLSRQDDLEGWMRMCLQKLEKELPLVYDVDPAKLGVACRDLEASLPEIVAGITGNLDLLLPCDVEVDLRSERLMLAGRLDRLILPSHLPSMIRTGSCPPDGVWKSDRLMLAGYCLLLKEQYGARIDRGLVEYPRSGKVREVQIRGIDRARTLRIRDRIMEIRDGRLPDRPEDASCHTCRLRELCEVKVTLASKFF